jgi:hypothetical protein
MTPSHPPNAASRLRALQDLEILDTVPEEAIALITGLAAHITQTGPGPLDPPTGKSIAADYVYSMQFDGDRIQHMTKIWNDGHSLQQLGWA